MRFDLDNLVAAKGTGSAEVATLVKDVRSLAQLSAASAHSRTRTRTFHT
jgi:hypothetical protein